MFVTSGFEIEITETSALPLDVLTELDLWFRAQFAHTQFVWSERPWRVVAKREGAIVGHIGLLTRTICVAEREVFVAGVGGVMTREEHRRQGIAAAMLTAAEAFMRDELGAEFGLLLCRPEVEAVYAKCGWRTRSGVTFFDQPSGRTEYPRLTMVLPLAADRAFPDGEIDLCGLPW